MRAYDTNKGTCMWQMKKNYKKIHMRVAYISQYQNKSERLIYTPPIFESVLIQVTGFREIYAILIQILLILTITRVTWQFAT